jgi:hypothetical protein
MINKKLQDYILTNASSLRPIDQIGRNIFYIPPTDHILTGFFIDKGKNYTYFGQIITPICDKLNVIGPGFGGRFEGECSGVEGGISDNDIGTSFIECVERYIESVQNLKQTTNFLNRFYKHDVLKMLYIAEFMQIV